MTVTSYGKTLEEALNVSYSEVQKIGFEGMTYRKDIGFDLKEAN